MKDHVIPTLIVLFLLAKLGGCTAAERQVAVNAVPDIVKILCPLFGGSPELCADANQATVFVHQQSLKRASAVRAMGHTTLCQDDVVTP